VFDCLFQLFQQVTAQGYRALAPEFLSVAAVVPQCARSRTWRPDALRHTFCSHLAMHGAAAKAIQELAGHEDLSTTQRYMHFSPKAVESTIRLLDGPVPAWAVES